MALVKCPKCGQSVSSFAKVCSKCGFDIANREEIKEQIIRDFNEGLQEIVDLSKEELIGFANQSQEVILEYLYSTFDEDTALEIFISFLSMCFAKDGRLDYNEYELLATIFNIDLTYESCVDLVKYHLNNDADEIDKVIKNAPENVRLEFANLCVTIAAIDRTITVEEKVMCLKYYFLACCK